MQINTGGACFELDLSPDTINQKPSSPNNHWTAFPVCYDMTRPIIDPIGTESFEKVALTKHEDWRYEAEYRIVRVCSKHIYGEVGEIYQYPREKFLKKVFLGRRMDDDDKKREIREKIDQVSADLNITIEVYQAKLSLYTYEVEFDLLS